MGLRFGMLMRYLTSVVTDGFIVLIAWLVIPDELVFVTEDLLFGFEELEIGRVSLRQFVIILYFEFTSHPTLLL